VKASCVLHALQVVFGAGDSAEQHACAGKNISILLLFTLLIKLVKVPQEPPFVLSLMHLYCKYKAG
jgi:hypothetical protein